MNKINRSYGRLFNIFKNNTIIPFLLELVSKPGVNGLSILHDDEPQKSFNFSLYTYEANLFCKSLIVVDCSFTTVSNV